MKKLNVLSWGGGTQSTALLLMILNGEVKDENGDPMKLDYVMFADTINEHKVVYEQIYKIVKYVKDIYDFDIFRTSLCKEQLEDSTVINLINKGYKYRGSEIDHIIQAHRLYFQGYLDSINVMPFWTRNKDTGKVGKTSFKVCTERYKIIQVMRELRIQENIKRLTSNKYQINMLIGYSVDELARVKPNPLSYCTNISPLVDLNITKQECIDYVKNELGFVPKSSVCNMCYANDFKRVYNIYKFDPEGWKLILELDDIMANKPKSHKLKDDVFMYRFQAIENIRFKDIDMDELYKRFKDIDDPTFKIEQEMACAGGCFL